MLSPYSSTPELEKGDSCLEEAEARITGVGYIRVCFSVCLSVFLSIIPLFFLFFSQPHPTFFLCKIGAENTYYLSAFSVLVPGGASHMPVAWTLTIYNWPIPPFISHIHVLNILLCKASRETHGPKG